MPVTAADRARKRRVLEALRDRPLDRAAADPAVRPDLEAEARSDDGQRLVTEDLLAVADARAAAPAPAFGLLSSADAIIVPGFMGSELADVAPNGNGLIWIDPKLTLGTEQLLALKLRPNIDEDATPGVAVRPRAAVPLLYGGLKYALEFSRYDVRIFGFDWRKHVDASAAPLAALIRQRAAGRPRPLHLIAHSQGSLVARRAIQMLGPELARRLVDSLVLLGPATAGTFSAAFALAGSHDLMDIGRRYGLEPPDGFVQVLQSMSGLYQLLPWRTAAVNGTEDAVLRWVRGNPTFNGREFWTPSGIDAGRLSMYGWAEGIDSSAVNDRTTIILGDAPTVGGVRFAGKHLVADPNFAVSGDGTVPDSLARVPGVARVFKARGAEHMMLPATWAVIMAVRDALADRHPRIEPFAAAAGPPRIAEPPVNPAEFFGTAPPPKVPVRRGVAQSVPAATPPAAAQIADVSPPTVRRLQVFSFDPLFAAELTNLGAEKVAVELPWDFADGDHLRPGPIGEYLEVVDFDASSRCFYPPVDLNHPHVLAQSGLPPSEGEPRFHQQMVYAVAMGTIRHFEAALGRPALWAPHLPRDKTGRYAPPANGRPGDEYVGRLRVYPHAMREANAFYSPAHKALLFGYFSADGPNVGPNLPGGTVFSSLSYDIIAHETTHALLDGLHRYFAALFQAFRNIYADRVADLRRIATGGTGVLPNGELPGDLVNRMADEATRAAKHMLRMCVRALDYIPPVDITFGEYLRALVTADYDLVRNDDRRYRVAVVSAFRDWGIYPAGVRSLSVDSLLWNPPEREVHGLHRFFDANPGAANGWAAPTDRRAAYLRMREAAKDFHDWLANPDNATYEQAEELGLQLDPKKAARSVFRGDDGRPAFHVHSFRPCRRIGPDGQELTDVVVEVVQRRLGYFDPDRQRAADGKNAPPLRKDDYWNADPDFHFRGGCSLIVDPKAGAIRYCIRKSISSDRRLERERAYRTTGGLPGNYLAPDDDADPFAVLHSDH